LPRCPFVEGFLCQGESGEWLDRQRKDKEMMLILSPEVHRRDTVLLCSHRKIRCVLQRALLTAMPGRRWLGALDHKTVAGDGSAEHTKNQTLKFSPPQ